MLAFVMLWAYFSFSQYLIIWSGNLPEEIAWYLHRLQTGWRAVGARAGRLPLRRAVRPAAVARRQARAADCSSRSRSASWSCALVDLFWLIAPAFHQHGIVGQLAGRRAAAVARLALARLLRLAAPRPRDPAGARSAVRRGARPHHRRAARRRGRRTSHGRTHRDATATPTTSRSQHEESDVNIRAIFGFGAGLLVVAVVVHRADRGCCSCIFDGARGRARAAPSIRSPPARRTGCRPSRGCRPLRARTCASCARSEDALLDSVRLGRPERRRRPHSDRRGDEADAASAGCRHGRQTQATTAKHFTTEDTEDTEVQILRCAVTSASSVSSVVRLCCRCAVSPQRRHR